MDNPNIPGIKVGAYRYYVRRTYRGYTHSGGSFPRTPEGLEEAKAALAALDAQYSTKAILAAVADLKEPRTDETSRN